MATKLFNECVDKLKAKILLPKEAAKISDLFIQLVPMTLWGKIDWEKINKKTTVNSPNKILSALAVLLNSEVDKSVYIEWSENDLPVIQTNLDSIVESFDDVISVAFDKFIFNFDDGYIIEVLSNAEITIGLIGEGRSFV